MFERNFARILMAPAKDKGGGGGGAGGGSGGGEGGDDDDDEEKFAERVQNIVGPLLNKALTDRDKRMESKLTRTIEGSIAALVEKLQPAGGGDGDDKGGDKGGDKSAKLSPEIAERLKVLEKTATDAKKLADDEKTKREASERKVRESEEETELRSSLTEAKVRGDLFEAGVALLRKRIVRDEEDDSKIKWKNDDGTLVDVKAGRDAFLKTPTGQAFMPARDAAGAGSGRVQGGGGAAGKGGTLSDAGVFAAVTGQGGRG